MLAAWAFAAPAQQAAPRTSNAPAPSGQPGTLPLTPFVHNEPAKIVEAPRPKSCLTCPSRQRTRGVKVHADGPEAGELSEPARRDYWCEKNSVATRLWYNSATMRCYDDRECCEAAGGSCSTPTESGPVTRVIERRSDL